MTYTGLKYTFADHCSGALHFVSGATGALVDADLPPGFEWEPPTSDPVPNQVDIHAGLYGTTIGVVVMPACPGISLLPGHLWQPTLEPIVEVVVPSQPPAATAFVETRTTGLPDLAQVARRLRDLAGLPVADLAAMVGIGRRQFYNLLERGSASTETELRVHHLAALLERLAGVVGEDPIAIRSALLTPVGDPPRSLFEVALAGEDAKLEATYEALRDRIERRGLRQVSRGVPRRRGRATAASSRAREALQNLPSLDLDPEEGG